MKTILFISMVIIPLLSFSKGKNSVFENEMKSVYVMIHSDTLDSVDVTLDSASVDVFPDPAHDTLCVKYVLLNKSRISIKIYELSGILADTLFDGEQNIGTHSIDYRTLPLKNGIYVIEILAGATEVNKRITIQK